MHLCHCDFKTLWTAKCPWTILHAKRKTWNSLAELVWEGKHVKTGNVLKIRTEETNQINILCSREMESLVANEGWQSWKMWQVWKRFHEKTAALKAKEGQHQGKDERQRDKERCIRIKWRKNIWDVWMLVYLSIVSMYIVYIYVCIYVHVYIYVHIYIYV